MDQPSRVATLSVETTTQYRDTGGFSDVALCALMLPPVCGKLDE